MSKDGEKKEVAETDEQLEGLDDDALDSWGEYPIDTLLIRTETRTVYDVVRRMEMGSFIMDPDFQRAFIWPEDKQSKLIESVLMRIPLPVFYLAEDEEGRMVVVDGLQRLSTFQRFFANELRLKLPDQTELDKKTFQELSAKLQNRVEDCNLVLYIIDAKVPERARLDIFERVNGGVPLTRQQMRNCLYMGQATRFLRYEVERKEFKSATGGSLRASTMRDREFLNRYCAFHLLPLDSYKGDMDDFLATALKRMNKFSEDELSSLSSGFRNAIEVNHRVFGKHAFRKHQPGQSGRSLLNASLWDVMSTILDEIDLDTIDEQSEAIRDVFYTLLEDPEFNHAITYSTTGTKNVRRRFEMARSAFQEVIDANTN